MYFLIKHPYCRNIAAILVLFLTFFTPQNANAQCNCSTDPMFIIGTNSGSETSLTDWIATNPSFPTHTLSGPCLQVFGTLTIDKDYIFTGWPLRWCRGQALMSCLVFLWPLLEMLDFKPAKPHHSIDFGKELAYLKVQVFFSIRPI